MEGRTEEDGGIHRGCQVDMVDRYERREKKHRQKEIKKTVDMYTTDNREWLEPIPTFIQNGTPMLNYTFLLLYFTN